MGTAWSQGGLAAHGNTHTHTQSLSTRMCAHTWSANGHTGMHTHISDCPASLYTVDCADEHVCTHLSHLHRQTHTHVHMTLLPTHMHIHKCPTHTCLSTHTCAIALTIWTDAQLFYLYTHVCNSHLFYLYACTHLRMPDCPAKTHTQNHPACTYACDLSASMCAHTPAHTQPRYPVFPSSALLTLQGAPACVCVNLSEPPACYVWVHPPSRPRAQHQHCSPEGWNPLDSWVPHGSRALAPAQAFGPQ